jgi:hypothetical protein
MSSIVVDTLTNQNVQLAKAWVNFNGTGTIAIRDSYNVSSLTDNATGDFDINFTEDLGSADFVVAGCCNTGSPTGTNNDGQLTAVTFAVGSVRVIAVNGGGGKIDVAIVNAVMFGI